MIDRISIRLQCWLLVAVATFAVVVATGAAGYAASRGIGALEFEHRDSLGPLVALNTIGSTLHETSFRLAGVLIDEIPIEGSKNQAKDAVAEIGTLWRQYSARAKESGAASPAELELIKKGDAGIGVVDSFYAKLLATYEKQDKKELESVFSDEWPNVQMAFIKVLDKLIAIKKAESLSTYETSSSRLRHTVTFTVAMGVVSIVLFVLLGSIIRGAIVRSLIAASAAANRIAEGDLRVRIDSKRTDDIGELFHALNRMASNLRDTVSRVRQSTETIANATSEIASGNQHLSSRTENQAGSLEETSASMEQLAATVRQNADNARQANQLAMTSSDIATRGGEVVGRVVSTMGEINANSRKIVEIISVIDGIAFQTNILALNAAVEAARAGEQGRGFAVVASEVRNLAQRAAGAAKEIKALIEGSVAKISQGGELADRAGQTMTEILESVKRVTSIMTDITAASQEQNAGILQVNQAVSQMHETTQQNASLVEEAAAAAASLHAQAETLFTAVQAFKLEDEAKAPEEPRSPGHAALAAPHARPVLERLAA